ncbi:serine hydrolase domain-containing protein [Streptomyces flavidovirens]|uniref:serine hydrolase domain-containing protein n=1 Tax=Streptomyces flavidovirens TaxID=67298 RepID=UPI00040A6BFA|nr:serine hydrolase domain-containing protein [Streptomyces flavidovirens]
MSSSGETGHWVHGDEALAERVRALDAPYAERRQVLSVALLDGERTRFTTLGSRPPTACEKTSFEIGSLAKPLTGMLLARLVDTGRTDWDTTVADLLPERRFRDRATAAATVVDLATHRSGLPRLPRRGPLGFLRGLRAAAGGGNPYNGLPAEQLIDKALETSAAGRRGKFAYSNLGMALLGTALAQSLGRDYPTVLREYVLAPLGMDSTRVASSADTLPEYRAQPHFRDGTPVSPWLSVGYAPAGVGVWSTAEDMARLLTAIARGAAPGQSATAPRAAAVPGNRIGLGWLVNEDYGRDRLWHNGATGGSASYLALDRDHAPAPLRPRGVVVLSNTEYPVDDLGKALLDEISAPPHR